MCNLNIVVKTNYSGKMDKMKKTIEAVKLYSFLTGVTKVSYERNSDGDGIFIDNGGFGKLIKNVKKVDYSDIIKEMANSNFIITHQRIATSGKSAKYTQPFEDDDFILVHNGIMNDFVKDGHSDTFVFFKDFCEKVKASIKETRSKKIISAIKELLKKSTGYYSIAIYDKKEKEMYYFKSYASWIYFYRSEEKDLLYITSNEDNKVFLKIFPNEFKELEIEPFIIYKVTMVEDAIKVYSIGKIKKDNWGWKEEDNKNDRSENTESALSVLFDDDKLIKNKANGRFGPEDNRESDWMFVNGHWKRVGNFNEFKNIYSKEQDREWKKEYDNMLEEGYLNIQNENYEEELAALKIKYNVYQTSNLGYCFYCGKKTMNLETTTLKRICDSCYVKNYEYFSDLIDVNNPQVDKSAEEDELPDVSQEEISQEQQKEQLNPNGGG